MGIERVYISSVWAEGFGYRQVPHTRKALHIEQAHQRDLQGYLSPAAVLWQEKTSIPTPQRTVGESGQWREILFLPLSFSIFFLSKLPWEELSLTSMLQKKTWWQTLKQLQALKAASHINVCLKQRGREPASLEKVYMYIFATIQKPV